MRRLLLSLFLSLLSLIVIALLSLSLVLLTEPGRLWVLKLVPSFLPNGHSLTIEGAASPSLAQWHVDRLHWQSNGRALTLSEAAITLQPRALLRSRLAISSAAAGEVRWQAPPQSGNATLPDVDQLLTQLPQISVEALNIATLSINELPEVSLQARLATQIPDAKLVTALSVRHSDYGKLQLDLRYQRDLAITASIERYALTLAGSLAFNERWQLTLEQLNGRFQGQPFAGAGSISMATNLSNIEVNQFSARYGPARVSLSGSLAADASDLAIEATAIDLALVDPWLSLPKLTGELEITGRLIGGWQAPKYIGYTDFFGRYADRPIMLYSQTDATPNEILIEQADVRIGEAFASATGRIDVAKQTLALQTNWRHVSDALWRLWTPWPAQLSLVTQGSLDWQGPWQMPRASGQVSAYGRYQSQPLRIAAQVNQLTLAEIELGDSSVQLGDSKGQLSGRLNWHQQEVLAQANLAPLSIDSLQAFFQPPDTLTGDIQGDIAVSGALLDPQFSGTLDFEGQYQSQAIRASLTTPRVTLANAQLAPFTLTFDQARAQLNGEVDWRQQTLDLHSDINALSWQTIAPIAAPYIRLPELEGELSANLHARGPWQEPALSGEVASSGQWLATPYEIKLTGEYLSRQRQAYDINGRLGQAVLSGNAMLNDDDINARLSLNGLTLERWQRLGIPQALSGQLNSALSVNGNVSDPAISVTLDGSGALANTPWQLAVQGQGSRNRLALERARVDLGEGGLIDISGAITPANLALRGEIDIANIGYWLSPDSPWQGSLASQFELSGNADQPSIDLDFDWQSQDYGLALNGRLRTEAGQHRLAIALNQYGQQRFTLDLETPQTALAAWQTQLPERPFTGQITVDTSAQALRPLFRDRPDQAFAGDLSGQLTVYGQLNSPSWQGQLSLSNGSYANAAYGTVLEDLAATIDADNLALSVTATGRDQSSGDLSLDGKLNWLPEQDNWWLPVVDLRLQAEQARLVRRTDVDATVGGELSMRGPWKSLLLTGDLNVMPLTIRVVSAQQSIASLNIVEQVDSDQDTEQVSAVQYFSPSGTWQVTATADQRAQIYMRGLQADLRGSVQISDQLSAPSIGGQMQVIRGTYTAFGKIFEIQSGTIQLQNSQILLDITARHQGRNLDVDLHITGNQKQIELMLASRDGEASSDELLTELLFGKRLEELSALEAVQLAAAANSLRGTTEDLGFFGSTRDFFGLDALTVNTDVDDQGQTAVNLQAGKYLSNRIYLEIETNVGQATTGSLQYQLSPNTNVQIYKGQESGSGGVEFNWSIDY